MFDLVHLKTFILTVEEGSLAAVARKLNISAAAVSKQLTRLEEEIGVQLLIRTTRHLELTEIGENFYRQCQFIFEEVDAASALISQIKLEPAGVLRVVSGRHFALTYIIPYLEEFLSKYPKIKIDLELTERIPDLDQEEIDVLIGMSITPTGNAIQKKIAATTYCYCASPRYLQTFGFPNDLEDLKKHRYIAHSKRKQDNEMINPFIKVNDTQAMVNLAIEGIGIVKLHHYAVEKYLLDGSLKQILNAYTQLSIPLHVAYPQRRFIASKIRCFIDFIENKIQKTSI